MSKLIVIIFLAFVSVNALADRAYKIKLKAINLHEISEYDYRSGNVDIQVDLMTARGPIPLTNDIAVSLPTDIILGDRGQLNIVVTDMSGWSNETIFEIYQRINLNQKVARLKKYNTGEYIELEIEKVEIERVPLSEKELQKRSLNIIRLIESLKSVYINSDDVMDNASARKVGQENHQKLLKIREEILANTYGEGFEELVEQYNNLLFDLADKLITATLFKDKNFPALPNAQSLLIYR